MVGRFVYRLVIYVTLFAFALQGCRSQNIVADEELMPYVNEYIEFLKDNKIGFTFQTKFIVMFNPFLDQGRIVGYAEGMFEEGVVNVYVSERIWETLNEGQRKWLIFHELSHDLFDLLHGSCELMKPRLDITDDIDTFNIAKKELAEVLRKR